MTHARIAIVGCGPGAADHLTPAASREICQAEVLVGSSHLLALFRELNVERVSLENGLQNALDIIAARPDRRVAVLVSGDPGIASFARVVIQRFGRQSCRVLPGVSSVQVAFAHLGLSWERVRIINAHAGPPTLPLAPHDGPEAILTGGPPHSWAWVVDYVSRRAPTDKVAICEDLSLQTERVRWLPAGQLREIAVSSRTIVIIPDKESFP